MRQLKFIIPSMLTIAVLAGCQNSTIKSTESTSQHIQENNSQTMASNFKLTDVNGKQYDLSNFKGKKVYIKFWASWCSICLGGLQEVNDLAANQQDFVTLSIVAPNYQNEKNKQDFTTWYQGLEYKDLPVLLDIDGRIAQTYGVRGYPTSAFIDSEGHLIKVQAGHLNEKQITEIMANLP